MATIIKHKKSNKTLHSTHPYTYCKHGSHSGTKSHRFYHVGPLPGSRECVLNVQRALTMQSTPLHISAVLTVSQAQNNRATGSLLQSGPPSDMIQPLAMRAEDWQAIPGIMKQRLSRWIVDAISLAYESKGLCCPLGVRAYSTRGKGSSWAWYSGIPLEDICAAAGWATPSTFIKF